MRKQGFECSKCSHTRCTLQEVRVSTGALSAIFNAQPGVYTTVACKRCGYCELYMRFYDEMARRLDVRDPT